MGDQKCVFQLYLLKYMLKSSLVIKINHITHMKHLGRRSGVNFGKNRHSGRLTFRRENKPMGGSRSIKLTHNVDLDMIKIIDEGNLIYFVIAI